MCTLTFVSSSDSETVRWSEDGGALGSNPPPDYKTLGPASLTTQGIGACEVREESCLLSFSLDTPVLGHCPSALALSRLKTTFSGCGVNSALLVHLILLSKMAPAFEQGLCSLYSPYFSFSIFCACGIETRSSGFSLQVGEPANK